MALKKSNSAYWNIFDQCEDDPKKAQCKRCSKIYSLGSESAKFQTFTSLRRHIASKHPEDLSKIENSVRYVNFLCKSSLSSSTILELKIDIL